MGYFSFVDGKRGFEYRKIYKEKCSFFCIK
jgi:hypothetical protein